MQEQDYIKDALNAYMQRVGCTAIFICDKTKIQQSELSKFRRGIRYLSDKDFESLKRYLNQR
ncbi:hypothetical protein SDC9_110476 [bioreactor metagenome]|uniref:XRE family transcriptional regulator n=1 Tax=bioreactor metagenome TaxID=1076179 RepID=A0A645BDS5_9ZZZZ